MKKKAAITTTRVFLLDGDRIFLMLRNGKNTSHGLGIKRWIAPGGVTEGDESALVCVIRETEEEIGLKLLASNLELILEKYDPKYDADMVYYVCRTWTGKITLKEKEKFDKVEWIKLSEVEKLDTATAHLGVYIKDAAEILLEQLSSESKLTKSSTPEELLAWMNKNLTYYGVPKTTLFTAEDVIKEKRGHCWETAELAYVELTSLGYECKLLYLEKADLSVTHTTLFYKDGGKWCWFEWAWGTHTGIKKNFNRLVDAIKHVYDLFNDGRQKVTAKYGYSTITKGMTQVEYIEKCNTWTDLKFSSRKPIYAKW